MDAIVARRNANLTLETPRSCQNDENLTIVWKLSESIGVKTKSWIAESGFFYFAVCNDENPQRIYKR